MNKRILTTIIFLSSSVELFTSEISLSSLTASSLFDDLSRNNSFNIDPSAKNSISTHFGKKHFDAWKRRKEQEFHNIQYNKPQRILDKLAKAAQNRAEILEDFYDARLHQRIERPVVLSRAVLSQQSKELKRIKNLILFRIMLQQRNKELKKIEH